LRPSIALCSILKDELKNLPRFLESVVGCYDEIHFTDTGSTDGSLEKLLKYAEKSPFSFPIFVSQFQWIDDFSAARNYNFSCVPKHYDFILWSDLDDVLENPEEFKQSCVMFLRMERK